MVSGNVLSLIVQKEDTFFSTIWDDSGGGLAIGFRVILMAMREDHLAFRLGWDVYSLSLEDNYPLYGGSDQI
ncbi:MAG: hypothetical protein KAS94_13975, partial [Desulfobulbaceae bacterium]|nr:hypothetical protein [Desulfobulbaceae bacterium]